VPLGSYLMCFRFLQVAWGFWKTGEVPHADHGVKGVDEGQLDEVLADSPTSAAAQGHAQGETKRGDRS
jgi:C4-dicarboxylate transporter DctQ subunit